MTYKLYPASEQILTKAAKQTRATKYPWHELKLGQAFVVDDSEISYPSMHTLARRSGARHGREYRVYHHVAHKSIEVAYVADLAKPPEAPWAKPELSIQPANNVLDEVRKVGDE